MQDSDAAGADPGDPAQLHSGDETSRAPTASTISTADAVSPFSGLAAAFCAYLFWGLLPIFWKALSSVDPFEVLCHRIVWSFLCLLPLMFFNGRLGSLAIFLKNRLNFTALIFSGFLLAGNWYLFIWAISNGMILESSLGYYINPLVNILFGIAIFRENTGPLVKLAITLAVIGVGYQVIALGSFPWVSVGLAVSFGVYGLIRKILLVQAIPGLFVETLVVTPFALFWLLSQASGGNSVIFINDYFIDCMLVIAGFITTVPLVLFAYGARRVRMTTLAVLQYVAPTCQFALGVFVYGEVFTFDSLVTFACIWAALALYTWESVKKHSW